MPVMMIDAKAEKLVIDADKVIENFNNEELILKDDELA